MKASKIIEALAVYYNYEIKTDYYNEKNVDEKFLQFLRDNRYENTYNLAVILLTYLKDNNISAETAFATFNKFIKELKLQTVKLNKKSSKALTYKNASQPSKKLFRQVDYVERLKYMFENYNKRKTETAEEFDLYLQDWGHKDYNEFLKTAAQKELELFLKTAWIYTGKHLYGFKRVLEFLTKLSEHSKEATELLNFYALLFNEYNLIHGYNFSLPAVPCQPDKNQLKKLSVKYNIYINLWFSPILRLREETFSDMKGREEIAVLKEKFINTGSEDVFEHRLLRYHYFKLLEMTITAYEIARDSFYVEKNWINNEAVEKLISVLESTIIKYLNNERFLPDQRMLSLKAAKDWIKFHYNAYNKKWGPKEIIEESVFELKKLLARKNYLHDSMVVGKAIEILAKIQDYCNYENVIVKELKEMYHALIYEFITIEHIRATAKKYCDDAEDYKERATWVGKYHEMSMSLVSAVKFYSPFIIDFEGTKNFNHLSMEYVHDYWSYFSKAKGRNLENIKVIKNSIIGQYV